MDMQALPYELKLIKARQFDTAISCGKQYDTRNDIEQAVLRELTSPGSDYLWFNNGGLALPVLAFHKLPHV